MSKSFNQIVLERTNNWAAKLGYEGYTKSEKKEDKKSEKVKALEEFLSRTGFDGKESSIAELFSIVLDEKVKYIPKTGSDFEIFTMVVPLKNGNDHPVGRPTLVVYQNHGVREDGSLGSGLTNGKDNVRPATEKEINEYFSKFDM